MIVKMKELLFPPSLKLKKNKIYNVHTYKIPMYNKIKRQVLQLFNN